jgi:predicted enzyme related to lactoylglutathione lyase
MLAKWYWTHLGINLVPKSKDDTVWQQQAGQTVFAPFRRTTTYWKPPTQQWMINFRVANLQRMVAQLKAAGIAVDVDATTYPNGRFAHLKDPEGNPIELWEPSATP